MKLFLRALHGPTDWGWVKEQVPVLRVEDTTGIVGIDLEKNETVAACVMDNWTKTSCQAHLMVKSSMVFRHDFLQECADYFFNIAKLKYVYVIIASDNFKSLRITKRIGFKERVRLPDAYDEGIDFVVLELTKATCSVLPKAAPEAEIINSLAQEPEEPEVKHG